MESNDHISKLPKDVTGKILSCLPIQDAVCTSILSRRWRYEWSNLSQIAIDEQLYCTLKGPEYEKKFVKFVDYMFLLHHGPISKFEIKVSFEIHSFIDRWFLLLTRKGIKELILLHSSFSSKIYRLPSCLFHHSVITCLDVHNCSIILPITFSGFDNLTKLVLRYVEFVDNGLQFLLSGSPNLKELDIAYISGLSLITISGLELTELRIEGGFDIVEFKNIPRLADACFDVTPIQSSNIQLKSGSKLIEVFGQMCNIQKLRLCRDALKYLAIGDIPASLPIPLDLNQLFMDINFEDMQDFLVLFCILRSCPAITKLCLTVKSNKVMTKIPDVGISFGNEVFNCTLDHLEYMNLIGFSGINSELMFTEFVLANAPVLKRMHVEFEENLKGMCRILIELIQYPRISPTAKLIIPNCNKNASLLNF